MAIAAEAGRPLVIDDFIDNQKKTGYARMKVELDASNPLKPGVMIQGRNGHFWQHFQYENLLDVCFSMWEDGPSR